MEEALHETSNDSESEWTQALRAGAVEGMLARAGLSQGGRAVVRSALGGASGGVEAQSPAQVRGLIAAQQQAEAALGGALWWFTVGRERQEPGLHFDRDTGRIRWVR